MGSRPVPGGGAVGYYVPFGWAGLLRCLGAQRPGGPACPAGSPFLPRNGEKEGRGQAPWTPGVRTRSFPLARFGVVGRSVAVVGRLRHPCPCPDLETFFHKMLFQHIFPENASQIGVRISDEIAPPPDQRQRSHKRASGSKRAIKPGGPGGLPPALFLPISREKWGPRRAGGPPGRCAPRHRKSPDHP